MQRQIAYLLLVIAAASPSGFTQNPISIAVAPQIVISLPADIPPEVVWMRYALYGPQGSGGGGRRGETLTPKPNRRHSISATFAGAPARYAKIVMYAPGCQFVTYDLDLESGSDITEQFQCVPLPSRKIRGFIPPNKIPSNRFLPEKKLDIAAYEDGTWVCRFVLQHRREDAIIEAGSCLGSDIPLGKVGEIDTARDGNFEITIPDFTRDPVFDRFAEHRNFGVIELGLREKVIGHRLGSIKPLDGDNFGLNIQVDYQEPIMFTTAN